MKSRKATSSIIQRIEAVPLGEPFTPATLLGLGSRAAVDQALSRLVKSGRIQRIARGVFVRPETSRYVGAVMPEPIKVAEALAQATSARVQVHGAEAARRFGLSTQVPMQPIFQTTGPSRRVRMGHLEVQMKHVAPRKLALAGRAAGLAIAALWYLGKNQVSTATIDQIERKLPTNEFEALVGAVHAMPAWMSDAIVKHKSRSNGAAVHG